MSRNAWLAPGGNQRSERLQSSIEYRGSLDVPAIPTTDIDRYDDFLTWVTKLDENTMRGKKIARFVVEEWTVSLSKSLVPQIDQHGNRKDFRSLEEWIRDISEIFPKKLQLKLQSSSGTRQ